MNSYNVTEHFHNTTQLPLSDIVLTNYYPFKKPWGIDVDHAAPLSHQCGSILALVLTHDLAVYKHWDQGALWEPPHIGLRGRNESHVKGG